MRLYELEQAETIFDIAYHGYHSGQTDATVTATINNTILGTIDFSVYKGMPRIQFISSKRAGLAYGMLKYLQGHYPDEEIDFGMTTEKGSKLYNSLKFKTIKNDSYDFSEYDDLVKIKTNLETKIRHYGLEPSDPDFDKISRSDLDYVAKLFNDYSDVEYDLDKEIQIQQSNNIKRTKKIII